MLVEPWEPRLVDVQAGSKAHLWGGEKKAWEIASKLWESLAVMV